MNTKSSDSSEIYECVDIGSKPCVCDVADYHDVVLKPGYVVMSCDVVVTSRDFVVTSCDFILSVISDLILI